MKIHHHLLSLVAIVCCACSSLAETNRTEANRVIQIELRSEIQYKNPFTEIEFDAIVTQPNGTELRVPGFWAGDDRWCFRYASNQTGKHTWRTECTDKKNVKLLGVTGEIEVVKYAGDNTLYRHGPLRVSKNKRHFEHADGAPFFWLGDTWWKGLCKRLTWEGFQELTADRKKKGFTVVQIVCGTYPDELGLLTPSWENEGGMPYLKEDFSIVNPEYFEYADRRFEHMLDAGITPAIVGGWGRAVDLNAVGLDGYKRHIRNLIARYGAYPVIWILGGETRKEQGPWYAAAEYLAATDPYNRMLANHSSHRRDALEDHAVFDFDLDATGHRGWETVNNAIQKIIDYRDATPTKPVLTGEACYEQHMQGNFADLQRHLFWGCILSGAAGHTYGAAGIWHVGTPEAHGNFSAKPHHQPYDFTTWREGMNFIGSTQLGRCKALLEEYPWQRFEPHPEWVGEGNPKNRIEEYAKFVNGGRFAAGIPGEVIFVYQPKRKNYVWAGITVKNLHPGSYSAFYFDPVSGRRFDLGVVTASGTWTSPNVPSPQDWVLVMQAQKTGKAVTHPEVKADELCSGKLEPKDAVFSKKSGGNWLTVKPDGSYTGTPGDAHTGRNTFVISVKAPGNTLALIQLTINVIGADGKIFMESFGDYKGTQNAKQFQSGLNVAHSGKVTGWSHSGFNALHAMDRSSKGGEVTSSDWAIMIHSDNVMTSEAIDANAAGETCRVAFEASPAVYAKEPQATQEGDTLLVEVLRRDGSVLKRFTHTPGKWNGKAEFAAVSVEYKGDGSGPIRIRIGSAGNKTESRFKGAIDNLVVRKMGEIERRAVSETTTKNGGLER